MRVRVEMTVRGWVELNDGDPHDEESIIEAAGELSLSALDWASSDVVGVEFGDGHEYDILHHYNGPPPLSVWKGEGAICEMASDIPEAIAVARKWFDASDEQAS